MHRLIARIAALSLCMIASIAEAQSYPSKPIRLLVGFPAGGSVDVAARIIAPKLAERVGQPVAIDNRPGSTGNLAADLAVKSPADGYLLYVATSVNAVSPSLYRKLGYDPIKDFAPVGRWITTSYILVVHPSLPANSVADLVRLAKARPKELNYGTSGNGSPAHLAAELLKLRAKVDMVHVPYKGGPQITTDLIAGQIQLTFSPIPNALPYVKAGRLRAMAVTSLHRSALAPEVPSVAESGYPGFEVLSWYGVVMPAGSPPDAIARINRETNQILGLKDVIEQLAVQGLEPAPQSVDEFAAFIKREVASYAKLIAETKIQPD